MKRILKYIAVFTVSILLITILLISGCKSVAPAETTAATTVAESTAAETTVAETTAAPEPVTIQVADWAPGTQDLMTQIDNDFMAKYPNITVVHEFDEYATYFTKVGAWVAAKDGPDLLMFEPNQAAVDYKGAFIAINDKVADVVNDYIGVNAFSEDNDVSKNIYALPLSLQGHLLYINNQVFKDAGLDPANPPTTWSDLVTASEAINKAGLNTLMIPAKGGYGWAATCLLTQLMTQEEFDKIKSGTADWTTDPVLKAFLELSKNMNDTKIYGKDVAFTDMSGAIDSFVGGKSAYFIGLISDGLHWKYWNDQLGGYDKFGICKFPQIEQDNPLKGVGSGQWSDKLDIMGSGGYSIPVWSENVDAAITYIKYVTSAEVAAKLVTGAGMMPANKNIDPNIVDSPQFKQIVAWANEPDVPQNFLLFFPSVVWDAITREVQLMFTGQASVDAAAKAIQDVTVQNK